MIVCIYIILKFGVLNSSERGVCTYTLLYGNGPNVVFDLDVYGIYITI